MMRSRARVASINIYIYLMGRSARANVCAEHTLGYRRVRAALVGCRQICAPSTYGRNPIRDRAPFRVHVCVDTDTTAEEIDCRGVVACV